MNKLLYCLLFILLHSSIYAQNLYLTTFTGFSNYQGDLQPSIFTFKHAHPSAGIGLKYNVLNKVFATTSFKYGKVSSSDSGTSNAKRNFNFSTQIIEFQAGLEYDLFDLKERSITPYFFMGVAVFHFNPTTIDSSRKTVYLQPLGTEGQGFYHNRVLYRLTQISVPFGGGFKFAYNKTINIGIEVGLRKTFTDYIDDVSTSYVDHDLLLANNGKEAVSVAFRGDETKTGLTYPVDGTRRGNPGSKDWYYFSGLSLSFRLGDQKNWSFGGKYKMGCPSNVY